MPLIRIRQYTFPIPERFPQGTPLEAHQYRALNALVAENVRNNKAGRVVAELEVHGGQLPANVLADLQDEIREYAAQYDFTRVLAPNSSGTIEVEARVIAQERLAAAIGLEEPLVEEALQARIAALAGTPAVLAEAQARLATRQQVARVGMEELLDG